MDRVRLLPVLAGCQALGIWLADRAGWSSEAALAVGCAAALLGLVCWRPATRTKFAIAVLSGVVMGALGAYSISSRLESAARFRPVAVKVRTVEATVVGSASGSGWTRVELDDVVDVESASAIGRIRVLGGPSEVEFPGFETVAVGTRVRARLSTRAYRGAMNPGSNPREREVARAGVSAVARLVHPSMYVAIGGDGADLPSGRLVELRSRIGDRLARAGRGSELIRALSIGDKSAIRSETRKAFQRVGLSHLLAVSGLHLALVGAIGFALSRITIGRSAWVASRFDTRIAGLIAALLLATSYALIAGWGVPVRRALVLLFALALAVSRGRLGRRAEPIAMASIAVLAAEPGALFDPGAQLSFAAATALAYSAARESSDPSSGRLMRIRVVTADALRASASAIAATAPLAAWHFGSVAPLAPVANLFAIPWTGFVLLPMALCAAGGAYLGIDLPVIGAGRVGAWSLDAVEWGARFAGSWTPASNPSSVWVLAIVALVMGTIRARRTWLRVGLSLAVSGALIVAEPVQIQPQPPRMIALDVGQGAASIIQGRHAAILFDGGGARGDSDWGQRAIVPALRALGIDRLDRVIVSHGDMDHRGGIPSVLEHIEVGEVWIPFGAAEAPEFAHLLAVAQDRRISVSEQGVGSVAQLGGEMTINGLWPPRTGPRRSRNSGSLVVRIDVNSDVNSDVSSGNEEIRSGTQTRILMPGDIGADVERDLLAGGAELRSDVLALAHHGSRTSSTGAFLRAVSAPIAIASAPCAGRFGMPHAEVRARTREAGMSLWWTGRDGAVMIGLEGPLAAWGYRSGDAVRDSCSF